MDDIKAPAAIKVAKAMNDTGRAVMTEGEFTALINKTMVPLERRAGESANQTFTRLVEEQSEQGLLLRKGLQVAKAGAIGVSYPFPR